MIFVGIKSEDFTHGTTSRVVERDRAGIHFVPFDRFQCKVNFRYDMPKVRRE